MDFYALRAKEEEGDFWDIDVTQKHLKHKEERGKEAETTEIPTDEFRPWRQLSGDHSCSP